MTTPRTRWPLAASLTLLALIGAMFVTPSVLAAPRKGAGSNPDALANQMLGLVNRSRHTRGLPTLRMNEHLCKEALRHSKHMARTGELSQTSHLASLIHGVGGTVFGEDLGMGRGLHGIRDAWIRGEATRRILFDRRFHHVGLGVVHVDGYYWVTLQAYD